MECLEEKLLAALKDPSKVEKMMDSVGLFAATIIFFLCNCTNAKDLS